MPIKTGKGTEDKKVSVIIPVYKVEDYLKRAVDSCLNQTYTNLEIILVDDGSPDKCPAICDSYADDPRVKVIHKENGGLSDARNAGLDVATGDMIAFLDGDDAYRPEMIETCVRKAEEFEADIVCCNYVDRCKDRIGEPKPYNGIPKVMDGWTAAQTLMAEEEMCNHVWNKVFARHTFEGVRFPKGMTYEDIMTTYKAVLKAGRVLLISAPLVWYTKRDDSITGETEDPVKTFEHYYEKILAYAARYHDLEESGDVLLADAALAMAENWGKVVYDRGVDLMVTSPEAAVKPLSVAHAFLRSKIGAILRSERFSTAHKLRMSCMLRHPKLYNGILLPTINMAKKLRRKKS